jgi:antitoxin FitA
MGRIEKTATLAGRGDFAMTTIAIHLSDERASQLRAWAEQVGLAPEEFLRRRVEQLLDRPDEPFRQAAAHVLEKNAELYRRLA